jgi:hypothetical protein
MYLWAYDKDDPRWVVYRFVWTKPNMPDVVFLCWQRSIRHKNSLERPPGLPDCPGFHGERGTVNQFLTLLSVMTP